MRAGDMVVVPAKVVAATERQALVRMREGEGRVTEVWVDASLVVPIEDAGDAAHIDEPLLRVERGPRDRTSEERLDELEDRVLHTEARTFAHRIALGELGADAALERAFLAEHGPARG